jgi:hypothetical protein
MQLARGEMQLARAHATPHAPRKCNVLRVEARLSDLSRYHGGVAAPDAGRASITWFSDTVPMALCGGRTPFIRCDAA